MAKILDNVKIIINDGEFFYKGSVEIDLGLAEQSVVVTISGTQKKNYYSTDYSTAIGGFKFKCVVDNTLTFLDIITKIQSNGDNNTCVLIAESGETITYTKVVLVSKVNINIEKDGECPLEFQGDVAKF